MTVMDENQIMMENVYNMDETGFSIGTMENTHVIINSRMRKKYQVQPGRQEWVTVVECICADGTSIPPLTIFKGENFSSGWVPKDTAYDWCFSNNSKGWTSNIHGLDWLRRCFEPATRDKANGRVRLLICDGHNSHITAKFVYHCIQNNIILLLLPSHLSHLTQPLDVGVFGPLKKAMSATLDRIFQTGISCLEKVEWMQNYIDACAITLSYENIQGGW